MVQQAQTYRILGIDPGTNYTGYGVLEVDGRVVRAVVMGEIGLTGEVRTINFLDKRLIEAEKMGFRVAIVPQGNLKAGQKFPIEVKGVRNVGEALRVLLGGA
jgi:predicted ATP-dependent serine protease